MKRRIFMSCLATFVTILALGAAPLSAQAPSSTAQPASSNKTPPFKPEELEQIVAPIALYPDSLLAQIFMASTYPLEIVEAARWSKEHPDVKGDAVSKAVESQTWDPSVKSLIALPDVLAMMNEKLDWTQKLGDAFLAQQKDVMDAVQRLRAKAKEAGNLKSSKEQTVKTEPAPAGSATPQTIIIEQADPQVVYVPTYNPTVVYGAWAYPAYPPYYYYPPGYAAGAAFWSFTAGVVVGGAIWGNCNWGGSDVDIDVNKYNNFNRNEINANRNDVGSGNRGNTKNTWQHNPDHRQGVGYRDSASQQKYGRASSQQSMQSREQYRGRAEQGRQEMAREGGAANQRDLSGNPIGGRDSGGQGSQSRDSLGGGDRSAQSRDMGGQSRDVGGQSRGSSSRSGGSSSAFGGGSGASTRASSSRGSSSRSAGGMSRGGGGGRRR